MFYTISCTWSSFNYLYVYFPIQFGQACSWLSGMVHDCQLLGPFTQVCRGYKYNFQVHRFVSYYFIIWSKWCIYFCIFVRNCKMNWQDPWSWSIETTFTVAVTTHRSSWSTRSLILWTVDRPQSFPKQFRPSYSDDKINQPCHPMPLNSNCELFILHDFERKVHRYSFGEIDFMDFWSWLLGRMVASWRNPCARSKLECQSVRRC